MRSNIGQNFRLFSAILAKVTCPSNATCAILHSRSLHRVRTFYKIFVLHDMHMILESLESDFKHALIDTKINQIACWEHIEPKTQYIAMA